ncbi:MAG: guanylate kinase [Lachnospiraceae bacterium]|nr:guanylate kinase [Lachnospiraceae bacterium]
MGKIFCIMGKSSSGKDTIYKRLLGEGSLPLNRIVTYTTRPIRVGEKDGEEYRFIDDETAKQLDAEGKIVELRAYNTVHGIWKYMTVADEKIDLANHDYVIIGTPESYLGCLKYFGDDVMVPILITVDEGVRLERALKRERKQEHPKYEEMCRRFLADAKDFSEEKLKEAGIDNRFENEDLESCYSQILQFIREKISSC